MSLEVLSSYSQPQKDRLAFIDLRARYLGEIRRGEIVTRFGIQVAAATRDISIYKELAPNNLIYNSKEKIYVLGEQFEPVFDFSAQRVLTWISQGYGDAEPCRLKSVIPCESLDISQKPDLELLSVLTRAIHHKKAVEITLQGVTRKKAKSEIVPFALANSGYGWLVRAFDRQSQEFCDVSLARISEARLASSVVLEHERQENDIQWMRIVELELVPHPNNSHDAVSIESEFGMREGRLKVKVRASQAGYFLRRWNVDCSEKHSLKGLEYRLWLRNRQAIYGISNLSIAPGYEKK